MAEWLSIEVFDGAFPARQWRSAHGRLLAEAAVTNRALDWVWHEHRWGVVLEIAFADEAARAAFRDLAAVRAALDAVPDPVSGLLVYNGRGGGAGAGVRSPHRPAPIAGAAALPEPDPEPLHEVVAVDPAASLLQNV